MKRQWQRLVIIAVFIGILAIMCGTYYFTTVVHTSARSQAIQVAQTKGNLQTANFYSEFDRRQRYFTVGGQDKHNKYKFIMIDGKTGQIKQLAGHSQQPSQAEQLVIKRQHPKKVTKVALGFYKKQPVWEVTYINRDKTLGYYLINFKNTKIVQIVDNL